MTDELTPEEDGELTELCIQYTGKSDSRIMRQQDLSGVGGEIHPDHVLEDLVWEPGSVVPYADWEEMAGSPERSREMLQIHGHEFELVGPGAEDFEWEVAEEGDGTSL